MSRPTSMCHAEREDEEDLRPHEIVWTDDLPQASFAPWISWLAMALAGIVAFCIVMLIGICIGMRIKH